MSEDVKLLREQLAAQQDLADALAEGLAVSSDDIATQAEYDEVVADIKKLEAQIRILEGHGDTSQSSLNVGDLIEALYQEDKQYYKATIVSKAGSSAEPIYVVKYEGYPEKVTLRKHEVRALPAGSKKRKADGPASTGSTVPLSVPPPPPSAIISAPPTIDKTLVKKKEPSLVSDGPTRLPPEPKKLKNSTALNKSQASWQKFMKTGPKGSGNAYKQKESQFRTSTRPGAKVGFTGSGQGMKKDQQKSTWHHKPTDDEAA